MFKQIITQGAYELNKFPVLKPKLIEAMDHVLSVDVPALLKQMPILDNMETQAKVNASKTMHSQTVKYISAEVQKCSLGESKFMGTNQDCPATAAKAVTGAVNTMSDKNPYNFWKNVCIKKLPSPQYGTACDSHKSTS